MKTKTINVRVLLLLQVVFWAGAEEECTKSGDAVCSVDASGVSQYHICKYVSKDYYVRTPVKCKYPKTKCHEHHEVDEFTHARCIDPTTRPRFPATGILRWNGTQMYDNQAHYRVKNKRSAKAHGAVYKDDMGRYFMTKTHVRRWAVPVVMRTRFELILPRADGTFVKYSGYHIPRWGAKHCTDTVVKSEGSLSSLWEPGYLNWIYTLEGRRPLSDDVEQQTWVEKMQWEESDETTTWTINYHKAEDHAIPTNYRWVNNDDWGTKDVTNLTYVYEPMQKEMSFEIPPYCE